MKKMLYLSLAALLCTARITHSQIIPLPERVKERVMKGNSPMLVAFTDNPSYKLSDSRLVLAEQLKLTSNDQMKLLKTESDGIGFVHQKYAQFYNGVKVEYASYTVHSKKDIIESISGQFESIRSLNTTPAVSAQNALEKALASVGAKRYMWQDEQAEKFLKELEKNQEASYLPKGELVILGTGVGTITRPTLTWKFDIYAQIPLSRANIFVDAQSGKIVFRDAIMKDANAIGSFETFYSGTLTLRDETAPNGGFRLRDYTRGNGIIIFNSNGGDLIDNDNNWTTGEYPTGNAKAGMDALFGQQATYDYFLNVHGRNSYNNQGSPLIGTVNYPGAQDNALWTGSQMQYGDATNGRPFATLDICGHEIGHGVCQTTAGLVYSGESGALNEALSDIWGACVERNTSQALGLGKDTWIIGDELRSGGLRSMINPRSHNNPCPAYYRGQSWYTGNNESIRVHTNSGVLNYWFYLISEGGSGINEANAPFCVNGIGIDHAAQIVYRMESVYLTSNNVYSDAKTFSLRACQDLYSSSSAEYFALLNAWHAVGLEGIGTGTEPKIVSTTPLLGHFCRLGGIETYRIGYLPAGITVTWASSDPSILTIDPVTGNAYRPQVGGLFTDGFAIITASYTSPACGPQTVSQVVYVGELSNMISGIYRLDDDYCDYGTLKYYIDWPAGEPTGITYRWSANGNAYLPNSGAQTVYPYVNVTPLNAGPGLPVSNYTVNLIVYGSCQSNLSLTDRVDNSEMYYNCHPYGWLTTYPNPSNSEIRLEAASTKTGKAKNFEAKLYNGFGQLVRSCNSNGGKALLQVYDLPNGVYVLRAGSGKENLVKNIQIKH